MQCVGTKFIFGKGKKMRVRSEWKKRVTKLLRKGRGTAKRQNVSRQAINSQTEAHFDVYQQIFSH